MTQNQNHRHRKQQENALYHKGDVIVASPVRPALLLPVEVVEPLGTTLLL